jgi:hypothetical protein
MTTYIAAAGRISQSPTLHLVAILKSCASVAIIHFLLRLARLSVVVEAHDQILRLKIQPLREIHSQQPMLVSFVHFVVYRIFF